jgi:hypothetical protein
VDESTMEISASNLVVKISRRGKSPHFTEHHPGGHRPENTVQ